MDEESLYRYRATYVKNYDGDTVDVNIDLGLGVWKMNERLRLYGIDTPEMRGGTEETRRQARAAKNYVSKALASAMDILIETHKDKSGKYGRLLAIIWYVPPDTTDGTFINLNEALVNEGLADRASY